MSNRNDDETGEARRTILLDLYDRSVYLHDLSGPEYDQAAESFSECFSQEYLDSVLMNIISFMILNPLDSQLTEEKLWRLFRLFLDFGASPTYIDPRTGGAPVVLCALSDLIKETEELLKRGADPNTIYIPSDGYNPPVPFLDVAVGSGNTEMVRILTKYGAKMRLNHLLFIAINCCPADLEIMSFLLEGDRNLVTEEDTPDFQTGSLIDDMFTYSWMHFERIEKKRGNTDSLSLLKGSESIMKNVVRLMTNGWPGPTAKMIVYHVYAERYGALVEYILGCLENGLPIVIPGKGDFEMVRRQWVLNHLVPANRVPPPSRGKSILAALIPRISSHPQKTRCFLMQLGVNIEVVRLEDICIANLRNVLTKKHEAKRFRVVCNALPLAPSVINKLTCGDLRMQFQDELKSLEVLGSLRELDLD